MSRTEEQLPYPRLRWPTSGWWFTVVGTLVGLAVLLFPGMPNLSDKERLSLCLLLILMPTAAILLLHIGKCARVLVRRALRYGLLKDTVESLEQRLRAAEQLLTTLLDEREDRHAYEVVYCYGFEHRTFIALRKKRGPGACTGADVAVVERGSGGLMGQFRLLRESDGHYLCELVGYMDALWLGNVKMHGAQHSEAPPEAVAWVLPRTIGESNEQSAEQH